MGGCARVNVEWDFPSKRTLVLVGRTGNGKSATGNTILGKNAFKSARRSSGVTETCELQETTMKDGRVVAVIDTPGLFDSSAANSESNVGKEIIKCIDLAKDGIHAVLVVLSTGSRFSDEEGATIRSLQKMFGNEISKYTIVVFTGGDDIPSLRDYLGSSCPNTLKSFISLCGGRVVLFDNKTTVENKKAQQVGKLLSSVDDVLSQNGGQPFTNDHFRELKKGTMLWHGSNADLNCSNFLMAQEGREREEKMTEMIELKIKEASGELEKQLVEERAARLRADQVSQEAQMKSNDEIEKLGEKLETATRKLAVQLEEDRAAHALLRQGQQWHEAQVKLNDEVEKLRDRLEKRVEEKVQEYAVGWGEEEDSLEEGAQLMTSNDVEIENLEENLEILTKVKVATRLLEKELEEVQGMRRSAEQISAEAQMRFSGEMDMLVENLAKATYNIGENLRENYAAWRLGEEVCGIEVSLMNLEKIDDAAREVDKQFAEEKAARLRAKQISEEAQMKLNLKTEKLIQNLGEAGCELEGKLIGEYAARRRRLRLRERSIFDIEYDDEW